MKKEFMVERQGKSFVLYAGLLDEAHRLGLKSIRTKLLQAPTAENGNVAICSAEVEIEKGTFTGLGDAAPENVSRLMVPHLIRMSETRAKARALRDAVNVGATALEELADIDEVAASSDEADGGRWMSDVARDSRPRNGSHVASEIPLESAMRESYRQAADVAIAAGPASATNAGIATPAQVRAIYLIARDQHGLSEAQLEERCLASYSCLPAELSKKQASEFITSLKR